MFGVFVRPNRCYSIIDQVTLPKVASGRLTSVELLSISVC
jgi:hypothetical protein